MDWDFAPILAFFEDHAPSHRGSICRAYIDNGNCLSALALGGPNTDIIAAPVARFWLLARRYDISVWFSRVKSELNPPGLPTRGKRAPYRAARRTSFRSLGPRFHLCRAQLRKYAARPHRIAFRKNAVVKNTLS